MQTRDNEPVNRWHYTVGDTETHTVTPVGGCARSCPGHPTADDAVEHFRQFLMNNTRYMVKETINQGCDICAVWTDLRAVTPMGVKHALCERHNNKYFMTQLLAPLWTMERAE